MERRNGREPWIQTLPTPTIRDSAPNPADTAVILNTSNSNNNHSTSLINNKQDGRSRARDLPRRGETLGGHLLMLLARDILRKELILLQTQTPTPIDPNPLSLNLVPKCINNPQAHISHSSQPQTNFAMPLIHSNRSNQGQLHKGEWFLIATRIDQCL